MKDTDLVHLGFCRKVHGIKGEFQFHLDNAQDSILKNKSKVYLIPLEGSTLIEGEYLINGIRFGNKVICKLEGVLDRNLAEKYVPFEIKYPRSEFPDVDEDEFYLSDLIGCEVINIDTDQKVGKILKFYFSGAHDIAVIAVEGKANLELPLVDQFFKEIDVENNLVKAFIPDYID